MVYLLGAMWPDSWWQLKITREYFSVHVHGLVLSGMNDLHLHYWDSSSLSRRKLLRQYGNLMYFQKPEPLWRFRYCFCFSLLTFDFCTLFSQLFSKGCSSILLLAKFSHCNISIFNKLQPVLSTKEAHCFWAAIEQHSSEVWSSPCLWTVLIRKRGAHTHHQCEMHPA